MNTKNFIWYSMRISFYTMIITDVVYTYLSNGEPIFFLSVIFLAAILCCFVTSIIHLNKLPEKAMAIVSLIFSSMFLAWLMSGFFGAA